MTATSDPATATAEHEQVDPDTVVEFVGVTKAYRLGAERSNARAALPGRWGEPRSSEAFLAVDDVSFQVHPGETVGIVGPNGAGKSTVLKLIAGSVMPTRGRIVRPRKFVSIIELGLGFDNDLSGLDNLTSGGALMGLSAAEVEQKRDEILDFAELGAFATTPVKRYSTGMLARLGFALATAVEADLYIIDEVLSVGDWGFQRKSLERVRALKDRGATIIFVSHNLWIVNQICDRALLMKEGRLTVDGPTHLVLGAYLGQTPFLTSQVSSASPPATDQGSGTESAADEAGGAADGSGGAEPDDADLPTASDGQDGEATPFELPPEFEQDPSTFVWQPVVIHDLRCVPDEIEPGDPMDLVGRIEVRRAVPGLRLLSAAYWEGFAGFAVPDELPSEFLQEPGCYEFRIHYPMITAAPSLGTFQVAVVNEEEPDDPEQLLPHALERARADVRIVGPVSSRPGVYFPRTWEVRAVDESAGPAST